MDMSAFLCEYLDGQVRVWYKIQKFTYVQKGHNQDIHYDLTDTSYP